ncbi:four helix bundle protein [Persephonella sp.]
MDHKDLEVWKESIELVKLIYTITEEFPKSELYGLTSQLRRSAISVPSNIAEGCARNSDKELIQFLYISLASLAELETQIVIAKELSYLNNLDNIDIENKITSVKKMLLGLIKYLKNKVNSGK